MKVFQKLFNRAKQPDGSYKLSSFWTSAKTVEFDDGKTLEEYRVNVDNALDHKGDGLFYDEETNYLYLLSGENRLSGVEITTGGLGEVLGDVSDVEVTPDTTSVTIKWTDPSDGQTVEWGGTTVVRKRGSRPVDCLDGEVVVESTTRNQYRTTGYTDSNLEKNTNYWFRFFPYTTTGQIRTGLAVSTNTLADETIIEEFPSVAGVYTYTGSEQTVTLDDYDENQMVIQSGNTGTDAGVYTVAITPKLGLKWPDNSTDTLYLDWTIRKASINLLPYQVGDVTYTGTTRTPSWGNYDENQLIISGDSDGVNAGTYTATFTPTSNYQWADGSVTGKNIQWTIQKANITSVPVQNGTLDYTGETLSPTWTNYDSSKLTISGQTSGVDPGEYIAVFTPTVNYKWADGTTGGKEAVWTIENKRISAVPSQSGSLTYNGNSQSPTWINYDSEKMTVSGDTGTDAGTYTATFTPKDGYMWNDGTSTSKTASWTINRQSINNYPSQSGTLNYTGSSQSPTWNYYDTSKMTISGSTSGTNAGTYTATFTPKSNYQWSGGSTAARSVSWVINKVNDSLTLSKTSMSFTSSGSTSTSTASGYHGTLSVSTSNSSVATASVSGSTITVTCKGSGSATITVTSSATTNYYSISKSISVSANTVQTIQYVPSQSGTLTYNSSSQSPTWSNYDSSQLTIGGTTSGTNAGTYTATFTPKSGYAWSDGTTGAKSVDWAIGKSSNSISLSKSSITMDVSSSTTVTASSLAGNISVSSYNTSIATASIYNNVITITGKSAGSTYINVSASSTTNYSSASRSISVRCEQNSKDISTLPVGALVKDVNSSLYGAPVIYRIIGKGHIPTGDSSTSYKNVTLESRDIVACREYNSSGNTEYKDSSLRTWLNSTFYNTLSTNLKNNIVKSNFRTRLHVWDKSGYASAGTTISYDLNDNVFVLSLSEKDAHRWNNEGTNPEGTSGFDTNNIYEYYLNSTDETRQKKLTPGAIAYAEQTYEGDEANFTAGNNWWYWSRGSVSVSMSTPNWNVQTTHRDGSADSSYQQCGWNGVAPALTVSNTLQVSSTTDSDGCYRIL